MPHALELEEFGLEVEQEHHALMGSSDDTAAAADGTTSSSTTQRRTQHVALSTPSKAQRSLLQSINVRPSRLLRPGMFKWATLLIALALVVFLNLGKESEEAIYIEEALPDIDTCEDDDISFTNMFKSEKNCFEFVLASSKDGKTELCNIPIGIPDENEFQQLLKHFCRKSCGLCGTTEEDNPLLRGENSEANIKAAVQEVAGEIEEKELQVKMEEEREEQARANQLAKEIEEELEAQENELTHTSAPDSIPLKEGDKKSIKKNTGDALDVLIAGNITTTENHVADVQCQDEYDSNSSIDKLYCDDLSKLNSTLRDKACNTPINDVDKAIEAPLKLIHNICRISCGMCGDATDNKDEKSAVEEPEPVKKSTALENEDNTQQEKKAATAEKAGGSKLVKSKFVVDEEVDQSNGDEQSSTVTGGSNEDNDNDHDDEDDDDNQSKSATSKNKLRKGDDKALDRTKTSGKWRD